MAVAKPKAKPKLKPKAKPGAQIKHAPDWWNKLSFEQRKEYIAKHPNSKFAKKGYGDSPNRAKIKARAAKWEGELKELGRQLRDASDLYGVKLERESDLRKANASPEQRQAAIKESGIAYDQYKAIEAKVKAKRIQLRLE